MTRQEYKAIRAEQRRHWSVEGRTNHDMAVHNLKRFGMFFIGMVILAGALGVVMR